MATRPIQAEAPLGFAPGQRSVALDSMRGLVMILLVSHFFGLGDLGLKWLADQFEHVKWDGFVLWEMIMPSFMFMIGVSMPFAFARRNAEGATFTRNLKHATTRMAARGCHGCPAVEPGPVMHCSKFQLLVLNASVWNPMLIIEISPFKRPAKSVRPDVSSAETPPGV